MLKKFVKMLRLIKKSSYLIYEWPHIALVDMVPELNATLDQLSKQSAKSAFTVFFLQNIGILTGIFSLFILAKFQDKIQIDF